jgi:hypothetical protein
MKVFLAKDRIWLSLAPDASLRHLDIKVKMSRWLPIQTFNAERKLW